MRLATIDTLRGLAILAMILIHSAAYFLSDKAAFFVWNYSQFAVPIFFFCSSYLFFYRENREHHLDMYSHFIKRFTRLLLPFYIYLPFYFLVVFLFDRHSLTWPFILKHTTMTTSTPEANWIVILFAIFAVLTPLFSYFYKNKRVVFYGFLSLSILSCVYFLFFKSPVHYKLIMWLPWSLTVLFGMFFVKQERKNWFYPVVILSSFALFIVTFFIQNLQNHPLDFFDNKYPPNIYYLSYGLFFVTVLFYFFEKEFFEIKHVLKPIHFLSMYSYSIFFIHFIVLYVLLQTVDYRRLGWLGVFTVVFTVSVLVQKAWLTLFNPHLLKIFKKSVV